MLADSTRIECSWSFAPEAIEQPGFDPSYAVNFWDITNQQDWDAVHRCSGASPPSDARPGPLGGEEDAVYQFVTMIARGDLGLPVRNVGAAVTTG